MNGLYNKNVQREKHVYELLEKEVCGYILYNTLWCILILRRGMRSLLNVKKISPTHVTVVVFRFLTTSGAQADLGSLNNLMHCLSSPHASPPHSWVLQVTV